MFDTGSEGIAVLGSGCPEGAGWRGPVRAKTPAQLAGLICGAQDRTAGLLFTATPTEDLDGITAWSRLADQSAAGGWRAITASHNRAGRGEREFLGDEVGLAMASTPGRGSREYYLALSACALPGLVEAVEDGPLTQWHVRAVVRELDAVPDLVLEQRQAVVLILLARFRGQDERQLATDTARLIASIDPAAAAGRKAAADARRQITSWPEGDGQGALLLRGPAEQIAAAKAAIAATAAQAAADGTDQRTTDQRMFDAAIGLLTGGLDAGNWQVEILIPYSTATGGDLELADLPGFGPILPSTARELAAHADTLRRLVIDADDGHLITVDDTTPGPGHPADKPLPAAAKHAPTQPTEHEQDEQGEASGLGQETEQDEPAAAQPDFLLVALKAMAAAPVVHHDLGTAAYRIPKRLSRYLSTRDRTCTFPGCHRPASQTDKDHRIPWPLGPTHPNNLNCLCRRHHRAKQASFTLTQLPNGTLRWTTRGGQCYNRPPQGF